MPHDNYRIDYRTRRVVSILEEGWLDILLVLSQHGDMTREEIYDKGNFTCRKATFTTLLTKMAKEGLVLRYRPSGEGRGKGAVNLMYTVDRNQKGVKWV